MLLEISLVVTVGGVRGPRARKGSQESSWGIGDVQFLPLGAVYTGKKILSRIEPELQYFERQIMFDAGKMLSDNRVKYYKYYKSGSSRRWGRAV